MASGTIVGEHDQPVVHVCPMDITVRSIIGHYSFRRLVRVLSVPARILYVVVSQIVSNTHTIAL